MRDSLMGDLLAIELEEMQKKFGEECIWVYEVLRGIDRSEVKDKGSALNKSMLASKNLPQPITKPSEGQHWIRVLAAELALRLNDARQMSQNLWPKTLVLGARTRYSYETGRSKQAPFPFTNDLTVDTIAVLANKLWKELVGNHTTLNVTHVQLSFTGIDFAETGQQTIEGFLKPPSTAKRRLRESDIDNGNNHLQEAGNGPATTTTDRSDLPDNAACPRCGKPFQGLAGTDLSLGEDQDYLAKVRLEHEDYHFAQDLANEGKPRSVISASKTVSTAPKEATTKAKTKKRKPPPQARGIEKFFSKS